MFQYSKYLAKLDVVWYFDMTPTKNQKIDLFTYTIEDHTLYTDITDIPHVSFDNSFTSKKTWVKLVAKQRVGLTLISKVKLDVPV